MLEFYKLQVDRGRMDFADVPKPYYTQMYNLGYREPEVMEEGVEE